MKVFISWSGERSKYLASYFNDFLKEVFESIEPWMSSADISAGKRWSPEVAKELEESDLGILFLTPENVSAPWIMFEAGALAKKLEIAKVIPLLFDLEISDISPPISDFQARKLNFEGVRDVITSINGSSEKPSAEDRILKLYGKFWPDIEEKIKNIPVKPTQAQKRTQHEVLEELVSSVRSIDSRFRDVEGLYGDEHSPRRRSRRFVPTLLEEFATMTPFDSEYGPLLLVMIAGLVSDDLPWVRELLLDAARELRSCDPRTAERIIDRLRQMVQLSTRRPIVREFVLSREANMMVAELPMILDRLLSRYEPRRKQLATELNEANVE